MNKSNWEKVQRHKTGLFGIADAGGNYTFLSKGGKYGTFQKCGSYAALI